MEMIGINTSQDIPSASTIFSTYYVKDLLYALPALSHLILKEACEVGYIKMSKHSWMNWGSLQTG